MTLLEAWRALNAANGVVYHVANPDVPGKIVGRSSTIGYVAVRFSEPVEFSGNAGRKDTYWECNKSLLFPTSEEAWKNKKY